MDAANGNENRPGGSVEPLDRAASLKAQFRIPDPLPRAHYELRDPFEEVTYRSHSFDDMVRKAERLGAVRFVAIAADGKRSMVTKDGAQWPRPEPAAVRPVPLTRVVPTTVAPQSQDAPAKEAAQVHEENAVQQPARIAALEAALNERYQIKRAPLRIGAVFIGQTEYRHRGDPSRVAFTESTFRLATDSNNPSVARSMVDVAEARGWSALRVSGHEDFRRMVWLEASLRDVRTVGYDALPLDRELLEKERDARRRNRIEPQPTPAPAAPAEKKSVRGSGSRKTVLAALEAVLIEQKVPTKRREAIMAVATEKLAERLRNGETHRVKVYDPSAPSHRKAPVLTREVQRTRDRPAPAR
jgi:hypothetical protein